jgi:hypothetical protein
MELLMVPAVALASDHLEASILARIKGIATAARILTINSITRSSDKVKPLTAAGLVLSSVLPKLSRDITIREENCDLFILTCPQRKK